MDKKVFVFSFLLGLLMISGFAIANSSQLDPNSKFFDFDKNSDGAFSQNDIDYWVGGYKYQVLNAKNLLYILDKIPQNGIYSCDESNIEACLKMPLYTNNEDSAQARSLFILNAFETTPALRVFSQTSSNKLSPAKKEFSVTGGVINNILIQDDSDKKSSFSDDVVKGNLKGITGSFSLPSGNPGYRPPPPKAECGNGQCEDGESVGSCAADCTPTIPPIILPVLCEGVICPAYSIPNNPNLVCNSVATYGGCCTGLYCVDTKPEIDVPPIGDEDLDDNDVPDDFPEVIDEDIIEIACETGIGAEIVSDEKISPQVMPSQGVPTGISGNTITGGAVVGICGDGKCTTASGESSTNCPKDCGQVLAGGTGVPSSRGADYQAWCGNGVVDFGEQCDYNGNNGIVCSPDFGRYCNYCTNSCVLEYVTNNCGDGVCNYGETYSSCSNDCSNPSTTDSDGDGIFNSVDTDDDNDGVNDDKDSDDLDGGDSLQEGGGENLDQDYSLDLDPNKQNEECSGDEEVKEPVQCKAISCAMPPVSITSQYTDSICVRESLQLDSDGCPVCGDITCEDGTIIPPDVVIPVCDVLVQCQPAYEECSYPSQAYDDNGCMVGCGPMVCENSTVINETLIISYQWELVEIAGASPTANVNPNVGSSYGLGATANIHLEGMFAQSNLQVPTSSSVTGNAIAGITGNSITGYVSATAASCLSINNGVGGTWEGDINSPSGVCAYPDGRRIFMTGPTTTPTTTPPPTSSTCGNNVCDAGEASSSLGNSVQLGTCPADCPAPPTTTPPPGGTTCPVAPSCPIAPAGCSYPNPTRDANNCITGCGTQVCNPVPPPTSSTCGNNVCDAGEDATSCPSDCSGNICISGNIVIKLPTTATDGQTVTYTDPNGVTITFIAKVVAKTTVTTTTTTIGGGGGTTTTTTTTTTGGGGSGGTTSTAGADVCGDGQCTGNENLVTCTQAPTTAGGGGAGQVCNKACAVDCGGTTTVTAGVVCPAQPNCPMPAPGCGYPNPTRDANNCITGCGTQVCTPPPTAPVCGNGVTEAPETCDAGNQNGLTCTVSAGQNYCDYCSTSCLTVRNTAITPAPYVPPTTTPSISSNVCTPATNGCFVCMSANGAGFNEDCIAQGGTPSCNGGACNCLNVPGCPFMNGGTFAGSSLDGTKFAGTPQCINRCVLGSTITGNVVAGITGNAISGITGNAIGITGNAVGSPHNLVVESPLTANPYYINEPLEIRAKLDIVGAEVSKYPIYHIGYVVIGPNNFAKTGEIWNDKIMTDPNYAARVVPGASYNSAPGLIIAPFPDLPAKGTYAVHVSVSQKNPTTGQSIGTSSQLNGIVFDPIALNDVQPRQGQKIIALPIPVSVQLSSDISTYSHQVKFSLDSGKTNSTMTRKTLNLYEGTITQISKTGTIPLSIYVDITGTLHKSFQSSFSYDPTTTTGTGGGTTPGTGGGTTPGTGGGTTPGVNIGQCVASGGKWDSINGVCIIGGGGTGGGGGTTVTGGGGGGSVTIGTTPVCTLGNADCGNGLKETGEQCDDGSVNGKLCTPQYGSSCNYCSLSCTLETVTGGSCGDGILQTNVVQQTGGGINEQCDLGSQNGLVGPGTGNCQYCSNSCTCVTNNIGPYCGDLQCNNGESYLSCPSDCTNVPSVCGNGVIETGETCDDGTANNGIICIPNYGQVCNYCDSSCQSGIVPAPTCGDKICQSGNENSISCLQDCPIIGPTCGNGVIETGEQCDPKNPGAVDNSIGGIPLCWFQIIPYGGSCYNCQNACSKIEIIPGPRCGDNTCQANYENSISCPSDCLIVAGYCGDGVRNNGEACDAGTGNTNVACTPAYSSSGSAGSCSYCNMLCSFNNVPGPFCGDGTCSPQFGETSLTCNDCIDNIPPSCPSSSNVVITNQTSATLQWAGDAQDNPGGSGLAGILLYRYNTYPQTNLVTTVTNPSYFVSDVSFVDNNAPIGLTPGNSYYYRMGVRDNAGNVAICDPILTLTATTTTVPVVVPFTLSIDSPTVGQVVNTSDVNFIVSLSQLGGNVNYSLNNGLSNLSMSANGLVFNAIRTGLTNGIYTLTAYAQNASGAKLTATRQFSVVIASAIVGVQVDLATGWNYFSVPESTTAIVGSGISSSGSGSGPDKELDLSVGWNLIGYSGVNDVNQSSLEFKGTSGVYKNLNDAAKEKRIQKRFVEYSAEGQKFEYSTNTVTEEGKAYWVYGREAGKLKAPSVGTPASLGKTVKVKDIEFQNETSGEIKNLTDALLSGWILAGANPKSPLPPTNIQAKNQVVRLWNPSISSYEFAMSTTDLENWRGYAVWSSSRDIKMIVPNA